MRQIRRANTAWTAAVPRAPTERVTLLLIEVAGSTGRWDQHQAARAACAQVFVQAEPGDSRARLFGVREPLGAATGSVPGKLERVFSERGFAAAPVQLGEQAFVATHRNGRGSY